MICPKCLLDYHVVSEVHTHIGAFATLKCGHTGQRNPDMGLPTGHEDKEVVDPVTHVISKKRVVTIDTRELLPLNKVEEAVGPGPRDIGVIGSTADMEAFIEPEELLRQIDEDVSSTEEDAEVDLEIETPVA